MEFTMKVHSFSIIAAGLPADFEAAAERFHEAGCDDATVSFQKGLFVIEFDREADDFARAVASAIRDVSSTGATVERIEPDPLVNASDIAQRSGLSRAAVSLYAHGERGAGFPAPVARVTTDSPLWDWADVAAWLAREKKIAPARVAEAEAIREANGWVFGRAGWKERDLVN
jgi:predicted DNA-binding transcriptional regulator AlpA